MSNIVTHSYKIKLFNSVFGNISISNDGKNFSIWCPFCRHESKEKMKLSIDNETGIYHCWVCEIKGSNIGKLAIQVFGKKEQTLLLYKMYKKQSETDIKKNNLEKIVVELPKDFLHIGNYLESKPRKRNILIDPSIRYLKNRGFDNDDFWQLNPGISMEKKYFNRIIFPSFDKNLDLNYFVARSFDNNKRRYKNCQANKKDIIFNEHKIDFTKNLILVEGIFDLAKCKNYNATCILGSWLDESYSLFQKIVKNKTNIILCLDKDVEKKTLKIANNLNSYCIDVKIVKGLSSDIGDVNTKDVNFYINKAKQFKTIDRMRYLINDIKSGSIF